MGRFLRLLRCLRRARRASGVARVNGGVLQSSGPALVQAVRRVATATVQLPQSAGSWPFPTNLDVLYILHFLFIIIPSTTL